MSESLPSITVAALQLSLDDTLENNLARVGDMIREAAAKGAQMILPPELFQGPYFCREEKEEFFAHAWPRLDHQVYCSGSCSSVRNASTHPYSPTALQA